MPQVRRLCTLGILVFTTILAAWLLAAHRFRGEAVRVDSRGVERAYFDLGDIFYGQTAKRDFTIHNDSQDTLILQGKTECGCSKMALDGTYVESGSALDARLTYVSFLKEATGRIENRFSISKEVSSLPGKSSQTPIIDGLLSVFVRPTITLKPAKIEVLLPEGQERQFCRTIEIENVGHDPVELHSDVNNVKDIALRVIPQRFTIQAQQKRSIQMVSSTPVKYRPLAYVADLSLIGYLHSGKSRIPLRFILPVRILPTRLAVANPGSLFFANNELGQVKTVRMTATVHGTEWTIRSIRKPDSVAIEQVGNDTFAIRVDPNGFAAGVISEQVTFEGTVDSQPVAVEVPVLGLKK